MRERQTDCYNVASLPERRSPRSSRPGRFYRSKNVLLSVCQLLLAVHFSDSTSTINATAADNVDHKLCKNCSNGLSPDNMNKDRLIGQSKRHENIRDRLKNDCLRTLSLSLTLISVKSVIHVRETKSRKTLR